MSPPAPCAVTLPAHRPLAFPPPPAPRNVPASRRARSRIFTRSMRGASFACPRLSASPVQPCPPPRDSPAPFAFPARVAACRLCRRPAAPAALPRPRSPPRASGVEWLTMLAPGDEQGRSPALPRNSPPREELRCALRLPADADLRPLFARRMRRLWNRLAKRVVNNTRGTCKVADITDVVRCPPPVIGGFNRFQSAGARSSNATKNPNAAQFGVLR